MKILTATAQTQGLRDDDFHRCVEGELVTPPVIVCDRDRLGDGGCGCGWSWAGLGSSRATTTAMVRDLDITPDDLTLAVRSGLEQSGWYPDVVDDAAVTKYVKEVIALAETYPVGAVLETRLGTVRWREATP